MNKKMMLALLALTLSISLVACGEPVDGNPSMMNEDPLMESGPDEAPPVE